MNYVKESNLNDLETLSIVLIVVVVVVWYYPVVVVVQGG